MSEDFFLNLFGNAAFPAAICFFILTRIQPSIDKLTDALNKLSIEQDKRLNALELQIEKLHNMKG